jgi:hypothetical protein
MNITLMSGSSSVARRGELDAVHLGHDDVGEQELEGLLAQAVIGGQAVVEMGDVVTGGLQRLDQEPPHVVVVFGQQNLAHAECGPSSVRRRGGGVANPVPLVPHQARRW